MNLNIVSYNCRGMNVCSGSSDPRNLALKEVLIECDILVLQETWFYKQDLAYINTFDGEFHGIGEATRDASTQIFSGRPPGGVAILWRRSLGKNVTELRFDADWLIGIQIKLSEGSELVIICIYMPYQASHNEDEFHSKLGFLSHIVNETDCPNIVIAGDFNADTSRESLFGPHLRLFCEENDLVFSSSINLPPDSHTFVSDME